MTDDISVIEAVLGGNIEAFRQLVQRYEKPVIRMINNLINDHHAAEDIAQDVFFTAYKKLSSFDPARGSFSTWLFTIARNKSLNALKRKKVLPLADLPEPKASAPTTDSLAQREFFNQLDQALQNLPPKQKTAFVLAELEKLPYAQIAQIERVRIGTIKSRINRAKSKLRSALTNYQPENT